MQETFYATLAGASFALLGLWWVVVEARHARWAADPRRLRTAHRVSAYFTLPGVMSLISLLSDGTPLLWRSAFLIGAALGAAESVTTAVHATGQSRVLAVLGLSCWVLVALVSVLAPASGWLGLTALQLEGVLLSLLLLVGVQWAWSLFLADDGVLRATPVD